MTQTEYLTAATWDDKAAVIQAAIVEKLNKDATVTVRHVEKAVFTPRECFEVVLQADGVVCGMRFDAWLFESDFDQVIKWRVEDIVELWAKERWLKR